MNHTTKYPVKNKPVAFDSYDNQCPVAVVMLKPSAKNPTWKWATRDAEVPDLDETSILAYQFTIGMDDDLLYIADASPDEHCFRADYMSDLIILGGTVAEELRQLEAKRKAHIQQQKDEKDAKFARLKALAHAKHVEYSSWEEMFKILLSQGQSPSISSQEYNSGDAKWDVRCHFPGDIKNGVIGDGPTLEHALAEALVKLEHPELSDNYFGMGSIWTDYESLLKSDLNGWDEEEDDDF